MTAKEELKKRMDESYAILNEIANKKTVGQNQNQVYALIGFNLGVSGKTVENYVCGVSQKGNGYMIDALIKEFKKFPSPKEKKTKV